MTASPHRRLAKQLAFSLVPALVLLGMAEIAVRLTGAATHCTNPRFETLLWACDPILFFKLNPKVVMNKRPLNEAGFRSREFVPKTPSTVRVLALGDSCTFGIRAVGDDIVSIREPYPQRLERLVAARVGPGRVEVLNAGVPGYSSFQGVMLLRTKLRGLHPDVITVRFGWNDHFVSQGAPGGSRETRTRVGRAIEDLLLRTQLYPFALRLRLEMSARETSPTPSFPTEWRPTVPLDDYKQNLRRIVELGRAQGSEVWLLTAPHAFIIDANAGRESGPKAWTAKTVLTLNALPTFERLVEIHESYDQASREVGAELGAPVVDMAAVYHDHAPEPLFEAEDVCHPTQRGHDLEAETLYGQLAKAGLVRAWGTRAPRGAGSPRH